MKACCTKCGSTENGFHKQREGRFHKICKKCRGAANKVWATNNREKVAAKSRAWRAANPDRSRECNRKWYAAHPNETRAAAAAWRAQNTERMRAYNIERRLADPAKTKAMDRAKYLARREKSMAESRAYYERNKDKAKAANATWMTANPEARAAIKRNRDAREKSATGKHSASDIRRLLEMQRKRCACCHADLKVVRYHVDHVVPLARGGANGAENLQLLCPSCNVRKRDKDPIVFMQSQGFLI